MKKLLLISLLCFFALVLVAETGKNDSTRYYPLNSFQSIEKEVIADLIINKDDNYSIGFVCDDVAFEQQSYEVEDGVLKISQKVNVQGNNKRLCKIIVTTPSLTKVENSGVGNVYINFESDTTFEIINSGVGDIEAKVYTKSLFVSNDGVGSVKLEGKTKFLKICNNGIGEIKAKDMISEIASVENVGIGSVNVYADSTVSISNEGFGKVKVFGNPSKQELNGKVKNLEKSDNVVSSYSKKRNRQKISPYLAVRLGFNNYLSNGHFVDGIAKVRTGASFEPAIVIGSEWKFCKHFWLNSELTFSWYNFKFSDASVRYMVDSLGNHQIDYDVDVDKKYLMSKMASCYINLELCPTVKIARDFSLGAGGFVGYNLSGRNKYKYEINETKFKNRVKADCFSELRYGVKAEITYSLLTFFFEYDFANVYKNLHYSNSEIKVNPVSFGLKLSI